MFELEQAETRFINYLKFRIDATLYVLKREGLWHCILTHFDKTDLFLKNYGKNRIRSNAENLHENINNYGDILSYSCGFVPHKLEQGVSNKQCIVDLISREFLLVRLSREGVDQLFYVLSNADRKQDIQKATSVEDIGEYGKILYSSLDVDPPEAIPVGEIIKQIFGIGSGSYLSVDTSHMMVRNGEIQKIRVFLTEGGDVNCVDKNGWTMLHHAAHCGNLDIVSFLINASCNIHAQDVCGRKPVHIASRESHVRVIELFLKNGVGVNETDNNGWSLLHYAAWKGDLETIRFLIHNTVEINAKDKCLGKRPIHIAVQEGHENIVEILLENGVHIDELDESGRTPFYYSVWGRHLEMARFLRNRGANIFYGNIKGVNPLAVAARSSTTNCEIIAFLLDEGHDIEHETNNGDRALHFAGCRGILDNVKFLIQKGANPLAVNKDNKTPLTFAKKNAEVASFLADKMISMFQSQGRCDDALKVYEELIEIQKAKLGLNHTETLSTHFNAATMLYEQARFADAVNILHNVIEDGSRCEHLDALYKRCKLGLSICDAETKFNEAVQCFEEVFRKWKEDSSVDNLDTLNVACNNAYDHFRKGEYNETFNNLRVALLKRKSPFDIDQPD